MPKRKKQSHLIKNQFEGTKVEDHGDYLVLTSPYARDEDDMSYLADPVNKIKNVTNKGLKEAFDLAMDHFNQWVASVDKEDEELKEGDKYHLKAIQDLVDAVDRPLVMQYESPSVPGKKVPMIFLPPRLQSLTGQALMNRLNL